MSVDTYPTPADVTLGTMSTQNANAVAITGGTILGLTQFGVVPQVGSQGMVINNGAAGAMNGLYSQVSSGTGRYNLYVVGTAPNYFAGNVGIGRLPAASLVEALYTRATQSAYQITPSADSGAGAAIAFLNAASILVGSITTTGAATAYSTSSDTRLKHSIEKLVGALGVVQLLNPVSFLWNADNSPGVGFRADELQQVIPDAVTGEPDALNEDGSIRPQQVDLSKLVPWLTAALQETIAQVEILSARVIALEARLA